jgi:hypothetical protein
MLGDAAEQRTRQPSSSVGTQDDQIALDLLCDAKNLSARVAGDDQAMLDWNVGRESSSAMS